ncbi:hypothetical protein ACFY1U_23675 [Streptomyces sp. NPDC001351]|uniref:hypothetical protein n=1 Tax=Streptomyces sp. NPDC001351 TaxID=3364564 RepID=UPI0036CF593F
MSALAPAMYADTTSTRACRSLADKALNEPLFPPNSHADDQHSEVVCHARRRVGRRGGRLALDPEYAERTQIPVRGLT